MRQTKPLQVIERDQALSEAYVPAPPRPIRAVPLVVEQTAEIPLGLLVIMVIVGAAVGALGMALLARPIIASMVGPEPKVFWYLSRASAFSAFVLIWLSMASGLLISNRMARVWPGAFTAFDLHQFTSLLGLGFALFHVLILLPNGFIPYSVFDLAVPFLSDAYRQIWVGIGQVAIYGLALVTFTFYIRKRIGNRVWRAIHMLSYGVFVLILLHGIYSGTDSGNFWISLIYWLGGISLAVLTVFRLAVAQSSPARA